MRLAVRFSESNKMNMAVNFRESDYKVKMAVSFQDADQKIKVKFGEIHEATKLIGGELYEGEYSVTPQTTEQTLETAQKVLTDDVTIRSIPFFDVSNTSGGITVFIGKEV